MTTPSSSQTGAINVQYIRITNALGPTVITIGARTGCALVGSPTYAGCSLYGGSGSALDPFIYQYASPLSLTGCSGGQSFNVIVGTQNLDEWIHTVTAVAPVLTAAPVPLSPWVPAGSALGAMLLVLWMRRRGDAG